MQAVMALGGNARGAEAAAGGSWRELSGRAVGPDGYRIGDGARTALRWMGSR